MTFPIRCIGLIGILFVGASPLPAQGRPLEIRADFVSVQSSDGLTRISLDLPGSLAMAFYQSPQFAIEPRASITILSGDGGSVTLYGLGVFFPFYAKADEGKSGFFAAPGVMLTGASGDLDSESAFDYGLDVGLKTPARERISTRLALTLRDGDSYGKPVFGAAFGVGFHWR